MSDIWFAIVWIGGYIQWIWPFVLVFAMLKAQLALRQTGSVPCGCGGCWQRVRCCSSALP